MKRLHVSFGVEDLEKSVTFYSTLFGAEPSVRRPGYAKWMLEDPRVNFVVETLSGEKGFAHAGIQVDAPDELAPIFERLKAAEAPYLPEGVTTCCYAKSEKSWTADPDGVRWEAFYTLHQMDEFGSGPELSALDATPEDQAACGCAPVSAKPEAAPVSVCC
ncbi:MAG: ArsI/CadI family heavy metal resistance metalloenzyme [Parvibaculum sp.]|uniref:ArsI/CadI family heavy metal resistance metalloenzyme n=1 Tax=Parvibaculum sp. TaxID=2024848 RepID=UPI0027160CA2|nr:ArsI/CadI family heavy metal resistance metalloenzyme [Parvibaculum sp.]MDO8837745.1 ArsI/CadI family heavy metal resistance metalloenzyme [Parvibaculum sp.]